MERRFRKRNFPHQRQLSLGTFSLSSEVVLVRGDLTIDKKSETLEGCPQRVEGHFDCENCNALESLKGAPEEVLGHFSCEGCGLLEDLEGAPFYVGEGFSCRGYAPPPPRRYAPPPRGYYGPRGAGLGISFSFYWGR